MLGENYRRVSLAGDDLISNANAVSTQHVAILAPTSKVWPWLLQIGQGRGGFYSHSWLENLVGCRIKNADRIHPEWQKLDLGDEISMHPRAPKLVVDQIVPESELVLTQQKPLMWSWSFNLFDKDTSSHLVVRTRIEWQRLWTRCLLRPLNASRASNDGTEDASGD